MSRDAVSKITDVFFSSCFPIFVEKKPSKVDLSHVLG